jgi:YidC/Oxa1 family membrane protein insertase
MDNQRLLIWAFFGLLLFMTYQQWMVDYGPQPGDESPAQVAEGQPAADGSEAPSLPQLPAAGSNDATSSSDIPALTTNTNQGDPTGSEPGLSADDVIRVTTDVLDVEINTIGGSLQLASLLEYPVAKDRPDTVVRLLSPQGDNYGRIDSGLQLTDQTKPKPDNRAQFEVTRRQFELGDADTLTVPLTWTDGAGVTVVKEFRFERGSYEIGLRHTVVNDSEDDWQGTDFALLRRVSKEIDRSMFDVDSYSFAGPIIYDGEKSEKLDRDDLASDGPLQLSTADGWVGSIQHHFLSAVVPPSDKEYSYNVKVANGNSVASVLGTGNVVTVGPGSEHRFEMQLFVGPKLQAQLEDIADSLKLTVDYGWLTIISQPLFWLLSKVHSVVGNWGWAIILVTILIKLLFYKLTEASGRSMAKMREIQPRMKALQDRYKDDKQQLSQAMMELYKREKVNPAAGCLPILIQMPFFLAFYWVLLESVEMRQAPFALWITDLSVRDPYFILPLIMGAAMVFQQRLNPPMGDPMQAKVMQIMPIIFTGFFAFFPAGLVLYWVTNTVLSIAQQWYINKVVHEEARLRKKGGKGKKKEKGDKND